MTIRLLCLLGICLSLASCGGIPQNATLFTADIGSDPTLVQMWQDAGEDIAKHGANLTAALPSLPADWVYPGPAAEHVSWAGVKVYTIPGRTIPCPGNRAGASRCNSYTEGSNIYVASEQLYNPGATGWEMSNVILERVLGFLPTGR